MIQPNSSDLIKNIHFGVRRGAARALLDHKRRGMSVWIWRDGEVVEVPPEEITIPDEFKYLEDEQ